MSRQLPPVSPEVRALLERERVIAPLPAQVRARSLARARAALVAGRVTPPSGFPAPRGRHWGLAVAAASIASAAVGTTAYEVGAHRPPAAAERPAAPVLPPVTTSAPVSSPSTPAPASTAATQPPATPAPAALAPAAHSSQAEPGPDELRLLGRARAAVARHEFAAALVPIGEHARRFPHGRLSEEREALRVRALSGLGRTDEARRAADVFEARFPRSVLRPAVSKMPASGP